MTTHQIIDFKIQLGRTPNHNLAHSAKIQIEKLNFWYGDKQALHDINLTIHDKEVMAFMGPSGCGKTTLLRCLNRSNDLVPHVRMTGRILLAGDDINAEDVDPPLLRRRFGWVAQKPNPFPWSVSKNIVYGARIHGLVSSRAEMDELVYNTLARIGLWDELKDRLDEPGTQLSGGQQQRLCIARAIATQPEVILMDEPASALDPLATAKLEELIDDLREEFTIVMITHNMQQAARVSQRIAFFHLGKLIECGNTDDIFVRPKHELTKNYIMGRMG